MISICVPVYNGKDYIEECIDNILKQTFTNFELIISDDCSTDNTINIIEKYLSDSRVTIIKNDNNLGWVKNCNLLISKSKFDYYCIIPHDDIIPDIYIETLYNIIITDNEICNCYPFINSFGKKKSTIIQKSILSNNIEERIQDSVLNHFNAVSFRGLVRKPKDKELLFMTENFKDNMWADTFQVFQHAISGKLIQVNVPYYKRYHQNNIHSKWKSNEEDYINFYFWVYMLISKYIDKNICSNICKKVLSIKLENKITLFQNKINNSFDIIIMGGGIQGCCVALYFAKSGYKVCIIDKNNNLLSGASANHEGKIHLGFVYSNDKTFGTAEKMLVDALNFSKSIEYLIDEKIDWDKLKSKKFIYLVPKNSLVKEKELDDFFELIQIKYTQLLNTDKDLNYLGKRPDKIYNKINIPDNFSSDFFECCYETEEYSINQTILNEKIIECIKKNNVTIFLQNNIENVNKINNFFEIITDKGTYYSDKLINCLWDGKNKIDNCVIKTKTFDTNYRFKFGIISNKIDSLTNHNSITMVNGPFGDFVNFNDYMYFSWYPYSMKGFLCSDKPPDNWSISNLIKDEKLFLSSHTEIFNYIFQQKFNFINPKIIGGIIVAKGNKDIDDVNSTLHERNEQRIQVYDKYCTISTGKFTSAPFNAMFIKHAFTM